MQKMSGYPSDKYYFTAHDPIVCYIIPKTIYKVKTFL